MTDTLDPFINQITTLRGPTAVVVYIIMAGYALKMVPRFPNRVIPLVSFLLGPALGVLLVSWPTPEKIAPDVRFPDLAAWATAVMQGFLLACLAWISHAKVLRKLIDDKIPALRTGDTVLLAKG